MDPSGGAAARFRIRRTTSSSSDRFLDVFTLSPPLSAAVGDDLNEDDVFWTGDFADHNRSSTSHSTYSSPRSHHHHGDGRAENFGILAALPPVTESDQTRSVFNHKASTSVSSSTSSTSSSSRMIPKKPPLDRNSSLKFHQSAPVNVPVMTEAMRRSREMRQFDDIYDDDDDEVDGEMLPPHEVVASRQSPLVACSVLEGVGRTLKGRDLRQVRNAVFRKTGFID
ncbi:hypothetical protein ACSBR2_033231 [Camellia fascicularis]